MRDRRWAARASGPLSELLEPAVVSGWAGGSSCIESDTKGTCGLLSSDRYGNDFWKSIGRSRAKQAYAVVGGIPDAFDAPAVSTMHPMVFGSKEWLIKHYR